MPSHARAGGTDDPAFPECAGRRSGKGGRDHEGTIFMKLRSVLAAIALAASPALALADPVGTWNISGTNLEDNSAYTGTVTIEREGGVYRVEWDIDGKKLHGIGLGGKLVGTNFTVGPASPEDNVISLGYTQEGATGMGIYLNLPDGNWQGVWTAGDSTVSNPEKWEPAE